MILQKIADQSSGVILTGNPDLQIEGIAYDSRKVKKNYLFVAIKGEKTDGARFVRQAIENGASAIASEKPIDSGLNVTHLTVRDARGFLAEASRTYYQDPSQKIKLMGITGTNGKTTTTYLMHSLYRHAGLRSCLVGTLGMKIGDQSFPTEHTTPEASDLMRFLNQAVSEGCTHGAMEVSSHSLSLKRVYGTKFTVGVFTNLTRDHLDFHGDMESYFGAKRLLFSPENGNQVETAVINSDDPYGLRLKTELRCPVVCFGFNKPADIHLLEHQSRSDGTDLVIATPTGKARLQIRLIGRPNIYNIMAAMGSALSLGIPLDAICGGIESMTGVPGRMETVDAGQDYTVIVDYAHSPDALENLLKTVSQLPHKRVITVFGCGGDRDRTKRPIMGAIAAAMSDVVVATSDNPRSEDPLAILEEIKIGVHQGPAPYEIVPDRSRAIERAISMARKGDVVVIAGKGHEDYQILGTRTIHFDDREVAWDLIRKNSKS
jgi:UDP-N-acetylmuramoyl-L-alanyl-D-glutamate--2,6-diaminopimelate ligase